MKKHRPKKLPQSRKATLPRKEQPVKGRVEVLGVITQASFTRGNKVESRWNFVGQLLPPDPDGTARPLELPMRIVRENWGKKLSIATPGSILVVEGRLKKFNGQLELHIVRGEIESSSTYPDGYKPAQRPDGSWRWPCLAL